MRTSTNPKILEMGGSHDEPAQREVSLTELVTEAHYLLSTSFSGQVKGHGLSATEWRVLGVLSAREGVTMTELAQLVLFKQPTLTKAIDRMERAQLVRRHTPSEDRRRTLVYLTERGRRAVTPLVLRARQHDSAVSQALGEAASRKLKTGLIELIGRLRDQARSPAP